jgi:hypothetical protein
LKLRFDEPLFNFAFNFNLRRYNEDDSPIISLFEWIMNSVWQGLTLVHFSA